MFIGGTYAPNAVDVNNYIDIGPITCDDRDNTVVLNRTAVLTKRLNSLWVAGTNQGGLDGGAKAPSTWYNLHEIRNPSTGAQDQLFSTSMTNPVMPWGYTQRRWVGAVFTDSSGNILPFINDGEWFRFKTDYVSISAGVNNTIAALRQLAVPAGAKADAEIYVQAFSNAGATAGWLSLRDPDRGSFTPSVSTAIGVYIAPAQIIQTMRIATDNVGRIYSGDTNAVDGRINLRTIGWRIDRTQTR